ncbi:MAG: VWA domain-containing protein [Methanosarcinaceae archaeon]|nr:VWA domain-containing protein [Methanosarcinaceae archaeon]
MSKSKLYRLSKGILLIAMSCIVTISMVGMVSANGVVAPPTVTKTASPDNINISGSGVDEWTTITLTVAGAGSSTTSAVPVDIVFAIDSSGSMSWNDGSNLRLAAAKDFVGRLDGTRDQAGVVSWDDGIDFSAPLTTDLIAVNSSIDAVDSSGGTDLNDGLSGSIAVLDANTRTEASAEVIIFLSDGEGSYSSSYADDAAAKGYKIYSIGLNIAAGSTAESYLVDMANRTGGKYFTSPSAENLDLIYQEIFSEVASSSIPHYVDVTEVTQAYIVDESSFSIAPDNITADANGSTVISWINIGNLSDADPDMSDDETVVLSFSARSSQNGTNLPVDVLGDSKVCYKDGEGNDAGCVDIPQAYINVGVVVPDDDDDDDDEIPIPEFPTIVLPVAAILGLAFLFQRRKE